MQLEIILLSIVILIVSVIIHELAHGYAALALGDPTAKLAGRLTLNPLKHLDPVGSVILPAILILLPSPFVVGWAKPVPYNPYNLTNQRWGEAIVAGAGPGINIVIAVVFGIVLRFAIEGGAASQAFVIAMSLIVFINILLAIFNLIPIPSFDGSKILRSALPYKYSHAFQSFETNMAQYGMFSIFIFILIFFVVLWPIFIQIILFLFQLITGIPFF